MVLDDACAVTFCLYVSTWGTIILLASELLVVVPVFGTPSCGKLNQRTVRFGTTWSRESGMD